MSRGEWRYSWISGCACLFLVACATPPISQKLTGEEIKALIAGRTYECEGRDGWYVAYYPNAETAVLNFTDYDGGMVRVKGAVRYEADSVCVTWSRPDWGHACYAFYREGNAVRSIKVTESARRDECLGRVVNDNPRRY
ncbi:MAG TPA: hypothetical protein VMG60_02825 [Burkholderiaceae bacterium]|nr:hypothetical protein [Burkholderiaceae bacterium]